MSWQVHKFGGTSVGNADRYKNVAQILFAKKNLPLKKAIVVSAMKGVTDDLLNVVAAAQNQPTAWESLFAKIQKRHQECAAALLSPHEEQKFLTIFQKDCQEITEILRGVSLLRTASKEVLERISGMGEVWSAQLLNMHLCEIGIRSSWLDARKVLVVDSFENHVTVRWQESQKQFNEWLSQEKNIETFVMTGFVASTPEKIATTLKRNGSDFSGAILAKLLAAQELFIWTDVDGVLTADPRLVPEAKPILEMSYQEVIELAYFGAKVVHPATMIPAIQLNIPIIIKNTFHPEFSGTKITKQPDQGGAVRGFTVVDQLSLINVEGNGMIGVPGVAEKLFSQLQKEKINVVLISQASSEHSICFAVTSHESSRAVTAAQTAFYSEIHQGLIDQVTSMDGVSILAAVGDQMAQHPGVAGKFFQALGRAQVNVIAIAQGSSERNISVVIKTVDGKKALNAVHSAFYLSAYTLSLGLVGKGLIGNTLLQQLETQLIHLRKEKNIDIRVRGILSSKEMQLGEDLVQHRGQASNSDWGQFLDHVASDSYPHWAIVDATASEELADRYEGLLSKGFHIVTPNKKAAAGDLKRWQKIQKSAQAKNRYFLFSTNVGAGLPLLKTLHEMVQTGDKIIRVEAVLSGTLSYIFNNLKKNELFGKVVQKAMEAGFTEPDPRDDLSGMDVLRKLIIIARTIGKELPVITPMNLVPQEMLSFSKEEFIKHLPNLPLVNPLEEGKILRYVASYEVEKNMASVGLKVLPEDHPFAQLKHSDNMLIVHSERYSQQPLIIQGPGAGPQVTAAGVFADILRLMNFLGAPL